MNEWGFSYNGRIESDEKMLEDFETWAYLMIHIPSGKAFFRSNLFRSEGVFKFCIDKWNDSMPQDWLHIPLEDIEGWELV